MDMGRVKEERIKRKILNKAKKRVVQEGIKLKYRYWYLRKSYHNPICENPLCDERAKRETISKRKFCQRCLIYLEQSDPDFSLGIEGLK